MISRRAFLALSGQAFIHAFWAARPASAAVVLNCPPFDLPATTPMPALAAFRMVYRSNDRPVAGHAAGTLVLLGCATSRRFDADGSTRAAVSYSLLLRRADPALRRADLGALPGLADSLRSPGVIRTRVPAPVPAAELAAAARPRLAPRRIRP